MAYSYPSYVAPTPYAQNPDIVGNFSKGYDFGQGIAQEDAAKSELGDFIKSLYASGPPAAAAVSQGAAPTPAALPSNQLVQGSIDAASGATDPTLAAYFKSLAQRESSNNPNAANPASTASGLYGITDPTWQALVEQNPNSGLTLDGKSDPQQQQVAVRLLTQQNAGALQKAGQPVNPGTLYAAHFLGAPQATNLLGQNDDTPMAQAVPADVLQANPQLQSMTVGQFKQWAGVSGQTPQGGYRPPQTGADGLPPQAVMMQLIQNPATREFAAKLIQSRIDPQSAATLASTEADTNLKNAQATAWAGGFGKPPAGYMRNADGTLTFVPGGPADPTVNGGRTLAPNTSSNAQPLGTTGQPTIDPTADGYSSHAVVGGLTQAAIDQKALGYLTSGTMPPTGRTGMAGQQAAAISNRMAEMGSGANLAANKTQLKALSSTLTQQTQYLNNTQRAFDTATDTLANLQTYMQKNGINASQFPDYNSFTNFLKAHGLDPGAAGGYNAQLQTLRAEYSQVLAKGGARSVETDRAASQLIPDGLSPAQLAQVAAQIKIDSNNAIGEAQKQVSGITDQINGIVGGGAPAAAGASQSAPPPAQSGPPPGAPTKTIGDTTYWQDPQTGKWFL